MMKIARWHFQNNSGVKAFWYADEVAKKTLYPFPELEDFWKEVEERRRVWNLPTDALSSARRGDFERALGQAREMRAAYEKGDEYGYCDPARFDPNVGGIASAAVKQGDAETALEAARLLLEEEHRVASFVEIAQHGLKQNFLKEEDIKAACAIVEEIPEKYRNRDATTGFLGPFRSTPQVLEAHRRHPKETVKALLVELQRLALLIEVEKLDDTSPQDLVFLHEKGFVRAHATGQSITEIRAEVESLIDRPVGVVIKPGTYFVAQGNYQNMVTRDELSFTLDPRSTTQLSVDASCINAQLPIPGETARFEGVKRVSHTLVRFLNAAQHADPMVVQAGVWAITDKYSKRDVQERLITQDRRGNRIGAVSDADVARAAEILDEVGIKHNLHHLRGPSPCSRCNEPFPKHKLNCENNPRG